MKLNTLYMVPGNPLSKLPSRQRHRLYLPDGTEIKGLLRCEGRVDPVDYRKQQRLLGEQPLKPPKRARIEQVELTLMVKDLKFVTEPPRKKA